jgi:hypothetical protein
VREQAVTDPQRTGKARAPRSEHRGPRREPTRLGW